MKPMELDEFKGNRKSFLSYLMAAVFGGIIGGILLLMLGPSALFSKYQPQPQSPTNMGIIQSVTTPQGITDIGISAQKVMPCVVGITRPIVKKNGFNIKKSFEVGTGVIVDSSGYIVTNYHVADNSQDITVSLYDGRDVIGRSVWGDAILDISIIKINEPNFNVVTLGDSKNIEIGDTAIAIGNPLGLKFQRSVTSGIISALNRTVQLNENTYMEDLIQTDASINPGNSGGPLININGEVIGINTVKVATAEGMGFAIPINIIKPIIKSIKNTGDFKIPVLGIIGADRNMSSYFDVKVERGIYVSQCISGSPGYNAGIRIKDTLLSVNGNNLNTLMDLKENLFNIGINGTAVINLITENGVNKTISVDLVQFK